MRASRNIVMVLGVLFFIGTGIGSAASSPSRSLGFAPNNIWYSKEPFFDGEIVRVHTLVVNSGPYDLAGRVEFYVDLSSLGAVSFHVRRFGGSQELSLPWSATRGSHEIYARIVSSRLITPDGEIDVSLEHSVTGKSSRIVAVDTDRDGRGDEEDEDDDNDGLTDVFELSIGSDPLAPDSVGDEVFSRAALSATPEAIIASSVFSRATDSSLGFVGSATRSAAERIDTLADTAERRVRERRALLSASIESRTFDEASAPSRGGTRGVSVEKIGDAASLALLTGLEFSLSHRLAFYLFALSSILALLIAIARRIFAL